MHALTTETSQLPHLLLLLFLSLFLVYNSQLHPFALIFLFPLCTGRGPSDYHHTMAARSFGDDSSSSLTSLTDAAAGISPDDSPGSTKSARRLIASASSPKRSRRSAEKRVVTFPILEVDGSRPKGSGEGAPPSDSWAWRKYGQKPIKGSPYPRGYYRCSSSKGCPARKQVERSRADPTMLVVTYSCDHNHPWPLPKNHNQQKSSSVDAAAAAVPCSKQSPEEEDQEEEDLTAGVVQFCSPQDPCDRFSDLISEEASLHGEYCWFSEVGSASPAGSTDDLLLGSITEASGAGVCLVFPDELFRAGGVDGDEEESLFAGLGELPECSVVFRRSYLEWQMLEQEEGDRRRCGLAAALR